MSTATIAQEVFDLELSEAETADESEVEECCNHGSQHDKLQNKIYSKDELKKRGNESTSSISKNIEIHENNKKLQKQIQSKKSGERKESVVSKTKKDELYTKGRERIVSDKNQQSAILKETEEKFENEYETRNTEQQKNMVSKITDTDNIKITLTLPKKDENFNTSTSSQEIMYDKAAKPQDFKILRVLGTGMFGKVFHVRKIGNQADGKIFAMKVMKKSACFENKKDKEHTSAERHILELVKHPFIVELLYAFQTKEKLFLVQEYLAGGELFTRLKKENILMEDEVCFYSAEIILVLEYLHSNGIIYRDLKPENILLDANGHIKLIDFGLCKQNIFGDAVTYTFCGTMEYIAPEVFARTGHGQTADWWSLGVLIYDMLTGHPPFSAKGKQKTIEKITKGKLVLKPYLTPNAANLIRKLLQRDVSKRLGQAGASDVKCHKFYKEINWNDLYERKIVPSFIPSIDGQDDTSRFDSEYLKKVPLNSFEEGISDDINRVFKGFSYVAPSMMEMNNAP